jgi:signal peptidase I
MAAVKRVLALAATVVLVGGGALIGPHLRFRVFRIPQAAMAPASPRGCRIVVHVTDDVRHGDIAAFRYPRDQRRLYVFRVVAEDGDVVELRNKRLLVNGRERNEPYVVHSDAQIYPRDPALEEPYRSRDQFGPYRVPADSFFVLGDNRDAASDSRYWGAVPHENILGRVVYVLRGTE